MSMNELAARLVEVASPHVWAVTEAETPEQIETLANRVVVSILRELASYDGADNLHQGDLPGLADTIELS